MSESLPIEVQLEQGWWRLFLILGILRETQSEGGISGRKNLEEEEELSVLCPVFGLSFWVISSSFQCLLGLFLLPREAVQFPEERFSLEIAWGEVLGMGAGD